ncbi:MAG: LysM peptidoglycan-binding domain-containing protein [Planctomycetota bacterium]|jgi:LysM repeat protein
MRRSLRALFVAVAIPSLLPDVVGSFEQHIKVTTRVDVAALADTMCVAHEVKAGDTLTGIARTRLGDARRVADLQARNPDVDPNKLKIGTVLWLPPRDPKATGDLHLVVSMPPRDTRFVPFDATKELPHSRIGTYVFALLTKEQLVAGLHADHKKVAEILGHKDTVRIPAETVGNLVGKDSPVARAEVQLKVVADKDGKWQVERTVAWFDAAGKQLPTDEKGNVVAPATEPKKSELLLLLLVAAGGAAWLLHARRRAPYVALA